MRSCPLILVGLSHQTAHLAVRERYAIGGEDVGAVARDLLNVGLTEAVVLSTCNRTEIYGAMDDSHSGGQVAEGVRGVLAGGDDRDAETLRTHGYVLEGIDVVRHLFRVASSLDSLVLGEPQILGQTKNALRLGREAGTVGQNLSRVFERAFKVAKAVRTDTSVGAGRVSVGSVAVDLVKQVFGDLSKIQVALLGAGEMAEAVAKALHSGGARRVVVANRTVAKALLVAEKYGWEATGLVDMVGLMSKADVVVASLTSDGWIIDRSLAKAVASARRYRPLFLVDIAVPRVVDPAVTENEGVYLYDIDDFNRIVELHRVERSRDALEAEETVSREVSAFEKFDRERAVDPLIAEMNQRANAIRQQEIDRALSALGELSSEQVKVLEQLTKSLAGKLLHDPMTVLRREAAQGDPDDLASAVRRLYRLDSENGEDGS